MVLPTASSEVHSEDNDSIMTDEIDEAEDSGLSNPAQATSLSQQLNMTSFSIPSASTSTSTLYTRPIPTSSSSVNLRPSGPVCEFGDRLGYTYFSKPVPTAAQLNTAHKHTETFWLTVDNDLTYLSFFRDTGPLNVGCLYRFCLHLHELLDTPQLQSKRVILFSSDDTDKKANAALLMSLYAMVVLRWSAADALHPIACLELQPFRDAGYARADFHLSCQDVLFGARKAIDNRLLRLDEFNIQEYEYYEKVENGDWNFITPHFLAFASPVEHGYEAPSGIDTSNAASSKGKGVSGTIQPKISKAFRNVLDYFSKSNVKMVVRLNKKLYDERRFVERGMEHKEMYFDDGTNPTMEMCREFIDLSERVIKSGGVVAVHCKAGLGRTGTLIGAYLIYKYGFTACEAIGFMRLMRPGTCVGPQQHFMYENQMTWVKWGAIDRYKAENPQLLVGVERPITPPTDDEHVSTISTPRAVTPLVCPNTHVPGQPRKTPGAKTRHTHAAPEAVQAPAKTPELDDDVFVDQHSQGQNIRAVTRTRTGTASREVSVTPSAAEKDEEMQLVVDEVLILPQRRQPSHAANEDVKPTREQLSENSAPGALQPAPVAYIANAQGIREVTPPVLTDVNGNAYSTHNHISTHSQKNAAKAGAKLTKARQQRPLTTITDNRQVDKIPILAFNDATNGNTSQNGAPVLRGKGSHANLTTLYEEADKGPNSTERYNFRGNGRSQSNSASNSPTATLPSHKEQHRPHGNHDVRPPPPSHAASSPSKLPQRVSRRKNNASLNVGKPAVQLGHGAPPSQPAPAVTRSASGKNSTPAVNSNAGHVPPPMPVARLGRNVRRRRSSTGEV